MISAPNIDEAKLKTTLEILYGINISQLIFIPRGESSWGYKVETKDNNYFLKLYKNKYPFLKEAAELTYMLYYEGDIAEIVHALKSKNGKAVNTFENYPFILSNYIVGKEVAEQKLIDSQIEELGGILGRIHNSTSLIGDYPKKETFESKDKDNFFKVLMRIKQHKPGENDFQKQFIDLLMPLEDRIIQEFESLKNLKEVLVKKQLTFVICHSDTTQGNILIGDDGKLYLIDWDTPLLAPKERDLLFFTYNLQSFMKGYTSIVGQTKLDEDAKQFYIHEWNVQEIADLGNKILFQTNSDEQNKHDLAELIHFLEYSGIGKA